MTGASKILTVSYGTFSCTLEGFDDPFNTMKAIAEYFRDLAADDRYFGAEPPTPDAAMLHRIAEREIHRRVEAKIQDNGVILRAGEPDEAAAPRPALAPAAAVSSATVAEKLQRIRAKHVPAAPMAAPTPEVDDYSEDEHAEEVPGTQADLAVDADKIDIPAQLEEILTEAEAMPLTAEDEPTLAAAELLAAAEDDQDEEVIEYNDQFSDEFADQPESEDFAAPAAQAGVDTPASEGAASVEDDMAMLSGLSQALAADSLPENQTADLMADVPEEYADAAEDADEGLLAALDVAKIVEDAPVRAEAPVQAAASDDDVLARLGALIDPEDEGAAPAAPQAEPVIETPAVPETTPEAAPAVAEAPPRARARVIRIRRADALAAATPPAPEPKAPPASALSAEAEAALQAELAALEAELGADLAVPTAAAPEPAPAPEDLPFESESAAPAPEAEDDAVRRLMDQADTAMGGDENRRRHAAIAHLKAAVAATTADRDFKEKSDRAQATKLDTYREDLDRVVRPRRPGTEGVARPATTESDAAVRPTPLVLVSEQRIDRPRPAPVAPSAPAPVATDAPRSVMPVRPRRVTAEIADAAPLRPTLPLVAATAASKGMEDDDQDEAEDTDNVFSEGASFGEFAEQLGATELPDLLEAAAVYCAEVLQRPEFSRPLVMRQLTTLADQTPANREDYLRGFGALLRQGRIAKVKRGLFALTDRSPYLAEARKIAG